VSTFLKKSVPLGPVKKAAGKLPNEAATETVGKEQAEWEPPAEGNREYFRRLIEETNKRASSSGKASRGRKLYALIRVSSGRMAFYNVVEEWRTLDAFYLSVTTLNTVGLGDLPSPNVHGGKVLTVVYIFVGPTCRRRLTT